MSNWRNLHWRGLQHHLSAAYDAAVILLPQHFINTPSGPARGGRGHSHELHCSHHVLVTTYSVPSDLQTSCCSRTPGQGWRRSVVGRLLLGLKDCGIIFFKNIIKWLLISFSFCFMLLFFLFLIYSAVNLFFYYCCITILIMWTVSKYDWNILPFKMLQMDIFAGLYSKLIKYNGVSVFWVLTDRSDSLGLSVSSFLMFACAFSLLCVCSP